MKYTEEDYLSLDPFQGDEAELSCCTVKIKKARKQHKCYSLTGSQDHFIEKGETYRYEKALVDRSFFGEYRMCLKCLDEWLDDLYSEEVD